MIYNILKRMIVMRKETKMLIVLAFVVIISIVSDYYYSGREIACIDCKPEAVFTFYNEWFEPCEFIVNMRFLPVDDADEAYLVFTEGYKSCTNYSDSEVSKNVRPEFIEKSTGSSYQWFLYEGGQPTMVRTAINGTNVYRQGI